MLERRYGFVGNLAMSTCDVLEFSKSQSRARTKRAGFTNAIAMMMLSQTISHMTGVMTRIGYSISKGDALRLGLDFATLLPFVAASFLVCAVLGPRAVRNLHDYRRLYAAFFVLEAVCILIALYEGSNVGEWHDMRVDATAAYVSKAMLASSMGIQNAITSVYSGGPGRSTHFTGSHDVVRCICWDAARAQGHLTRSTICMRDLGFVADITMTLGFSAHMRSKNTANWFRLSFMPSGLLMFMFGACCASPTVASIGVNALYVPIAVSFLAAAYCLVHGWVNKNVPSLSRCDSCSSTKRKRTLTFSASFSLCSHADIGSMMANSRGGPTVLRSYWCRQ